MVKKTTKLSARYEHIKPQKTAGKGMKRLTRAKKHSKYAKETPGLLVRRSKVGRALRKSYQRQIDRFTKLTGLEHTGKKAMVKKDFVQLMTAVLDAYANSVMDMAFQFASSRKTRGLKVRKEDLLKAVKIIHHFAKNN